MKKPLVKLSDVTKNFGQKTVLENVNLSINEGMLYAITGRSGSGKSTLLNIIGGIEKATSGKVTIFGNEHITPNSLVLKKLLRHKLSFLFQNYALSDNDTVEYNLKMALAYHRGVRNKKQAIKDALNQVGLKGYEKNRIHELSGGEQQRVAMARVLLKPSQLVLADEPTGNLDTQNRDIIFNLLLQLKEVGKTIVLVTHDEELVQKCDEVINL